ncbi:YcxB family protein [Nocardia asteroides]|uniref:YcxB family protein n=1 Tax=Nocardia asteroides TaxID=1824 RepID=UPI001E5EE8B5|nr:YcxB family protein [Nocardia asteroides]UGT54643.1 YcxB family protein [Nocardia asteroides]
MVIPSPCDRIGPAAADQSLSLWQTSGQVSNRYADIKRVITQGDVVFVQTTGTQGFVLPREIVPDAALARLRGAAA